MHSSVLAAAVACLRWLRVGAFLSCSPSLPVNARYKHTMDKVRMVLLRALSCAGSSDAPWIIDTVVPAVLALDWPRGFAPAAVREALLEVESWRFRPRLAISRSVLLAHLDPDSTHHLLYRDAGPSSDWERMLVTRNAFVLANLLGSSSFSESIAARAHTRSARVCDLPSSAAGHTPSQFVKQIASRNLSRGQVSEFVESGVFSLALRSKQGSLASMASALRVWGSFCNTMGCAHFPVELARAAQFACVCREPGTYKVYIAHIRSACEFLGLSVSWADAPLISRVKLGVEKSVLVVKGPKLFVGADLMVRIASA